MTVDILISCMNRKDPSIIDQSNLTDAHVVVVNQNPDADDTTAINPHAVWINSTARGLSNSRNLAISSSKADVCMICDDDEVFVDNAESIIARAYEAHPEADLILFQISNFARRFGDQEKKLGFLDTLKVSSQQISFRRASVAGIAYDPLIGAGTGNGAGEESKFLWQCKKKGLTLLYLPIEIAEIKEDSDSTWFHGYDETFFYNNGRTIRYIYGLPFSLLFSVYTVMKHGEMFDTVPRWKALFIMWKGIFKNDIGKN